MFYQLNWPTDGKYAECYPENPTYVYDGVERCPFCQRIVEGKHWAHPRTLRITNSRYADFLFTTPYPAVSERFKRLYEASGLTGILSFDPIENYRLRKNAPDSPRYFTIKSIRSKMKIDYTHSDITWLSPHEHRCDLCDPFGRCISDIKKLTLYDSNYDGSDVFRLYETGDATYLSEDFVKFVKENHLTNLGLRPLPDMQQRIIIR